MMTSVQKRIGISFITLLAIAISSFWAGMCFKFEKSFSTLPALIYIDFTDNNYPLFLSNVSGMSGREDWGRWTDANLSPEAKFVFKDSLPEKLTLELKVHFITDPNIGQPIKVIVGGVEKTFTISKKGDEIVKLDFSGVKGNTIEIIPPKPTSPKDLGVNEDTRKLGIGIVYMKVLQAVTAHGK